MDNVINMHAASIGRNAGMRTTSEGNSLCLSAMCYDSGLVSLSVNEVIEQRQQRRLQEVHQVIGTVQPEITGTLAETVYTNHQLLQTVRSGCSDTAIS